MANKIEILYKSADTMSNFIKNKKMDPNNQNEVCTWPKTFLNWKESVQRAEQVFKQEPVTELQWVVVETYLCNRYGFTPLEKAKPKEA